MKARLAIILFCLVISLAACNSQVKEPNEVDLLGTAIAEATQIIRQAQSTALVLDAQRQATAIMAGLTGHSTIPSTTLEATTILPVQSPEAQYTPTTAGQGTPTSQGSTVEMLGVEIGTEGNFIVVYFRAPPSVAGSWYQGIVSVTDEASGTVYNEIPVLPVVGPLFGKPVEAGQIGYVMLVNAPVPLQSGSFVTVTLGEYVFEHIQVK